MKQYLPKTKRSKNPPPFSLTERDISIIEDVYLHRYLTTSQIEILRANSSDSSLRFNSRSRLNQRLKRLYHHKYLNRAFPPTLHGSEEPFYYLDKNSTTILNPKYGEVKYRKTSAFPDFEYLKHLSYINDFRISLLIASEEQKVQILSFLYDWQLKDKKRYSTDCSLSGNCKKLKLVPDAEVVLRDEIGRLLFFLEVDKATESSKVILKKYREYSYYWRSGRFQKDYGLKEGASFRVLFLAATLPRLTLLREKVEELESGKELFWFSLFEKITPRRIFGEIWTKGHTDSLHSILE